ncbi:alpha/beta hydrolase [Mycobacterium sp. 21AC1]|nr:alpha/beta hydrolase [Mycobacterium sp. 21AC1]MDV3125007.1 alpha/beta hydrolase [Mycobacterium sp. 21AC1]
MSFPDIAGRTDVVSIPTRHGQVEATVYRPPASADPIPGVYVNIHGGGFVVGHREQDDPWCRFLAANAGVAVVNTDYLLAPARRFPTPVEQIADVVRWASSPERDWDGSQLCIGGQSAGGNLAAAVSRLALDDGGPRIALQVLHYAPLDLVTATRDKPSPRRGKAVLRPWMGDVFDTAYIPDRNRRRDPLASPAWGENGTNLAGIAPALVVTAELDRLRAEAAAYACRLDAVGALAEYIEVPGLDHGYNIMSDAPNAVAATTQTYRRIVEHVVRAIGVERERPRD